VELKGRKLQEFLSSTIDHQQLESLLVARPNLGAKARVEYSQRIARLRSCAGDGVMVWLDGPPSAESGAILTRRVSVRRFVSAWGFRLDYPHTARRATILKTVLETMRSRAQILRLALTLATVLSATAFILSAVEGG